MTDTVLISCHFCSKVLGSRTLEDGATLPPSEAVTWHERTAAHIKREHVRKRAPKAQEEAS